MEFSKPESYAKQIILYLSSADYQSAYKLSKEFTNKFSKNVFALILLSKSAFWLGKYPETIIEARKGEFQS